MRAVICAIVMLLVVPISGQQRGVVRGVAVLKTQAQTGVPVEITITGTNPCGAVRVDPGDGSERVTHAIRQVPTTVRYVYRKAGRFQVRAEGMGNCDGIAETTLQVIAAPAPTSSAPSRVGASARHVLDMDRDHDGVVTRGEWHGSDDEFRDRDRNGDGVLSGAEVQDEPGEVVVKAVDRWTRTGVLVREGEVVRLSSAGTVQLSGSAADTCSPEGTGRRAPSAPMPDMPAGGLIARIGNAPPIFIGADSAFRANASGQLLLGVNDDELSDNRGSFRVRVQASSHDRRR